MHIAFTHRVRPISNAALRRIVGGGRLHQIIPLLEDPVRYMQRFSKFGLVSTAKWLIALICFNIDSIRRFINN